MDNRVGDNVPEAAQLEQMRERLKQIIDDIKRFGLTLSTDERRHLVHARRDGDEHVERVFGLSQKYGQNIPGIPLAGMMNDLGLNKSLRPLVDLFALGHQLVDDTASQSEHEYWQAFLAYYAQLSSLAERVPELAKELEPTLRFMALRRKNKSDDK